jgi:tripartite-type tricarboxylate transporter receptor subunit TctC
MRPSIWASVTALAAMLSSAESATAQTWPTRPVTMVVGFAAGGGTDVLGRIVGKRLSEPLGQQVVIENVGGAGGMVGSARVAKSPPDGYQFVLGSRADAINQTLYKRPLYDFRTDLVPVVLVADQPMVMVARNDLPANNLQEFIAYAKKNQSAMQFGSAGAGSTGHLDCLLFNMAIGVNITHVPYRGGGPAMQDLIGGRIDYFCTLTGTAVPTIENKLVKAIGVFTKSRAPMLLNVPSSFEQGFTDFEASTWFGFFVPKGTPEPVIKRLHEASVEAMNTPSVQEQALKAGAVIVTPERRSTEYLKRYVESEIEKNAAPIKAAGISIE